MQGWCRAGTERGQVMGYFPNGTSGAEYENRYCDHCKHQAPDDGGCAVMLAHLVHNYDQFDNEAVKGILDTLIPEKDGVNMRCAMFIPLDADRCTDTPDMFAMGGK
jgi:hypothetical protein